MVYKISWESGRLPWQPNLSKKIALISSLQEIEKFIACTVGISGLVNFNALSEFLREPRELPWQPNLGKNKPKLHRFQFCSRYRGIYHMIKKLSGSANSNMVYKISWESGRLPWQPNLGKKCTHQFYARNREIFRIQLGSQDWWISIRYHNF